MKNHLIKITKTRHTLCIMNYTLCIVFSALCIILTSCGNPSAGSGVPVFFTDAKVVSAGSSHTVAIKNDGTLWAWGGNYRGQLGDGTTRSSNTSIRIGTDNDWLTVSAGSEHTVAIKTDGSLWAWGNNTDGQLGKGYAGAKSGDPNAHYSPEQIGTNWLTVSAGDKHTVAIKTDGSLWAWGFNTNGQLGDGTNTTRNSPFSISETNTPNTNWLAVSAGSSYTVAIKTDGSLWAWGYNQYGQLGDGNSGSGASKTSPVSISVTNTPNTNWIAVSAGSYFHTVAIKTDGSLWAWGYNYYGQLGDDTIDDSHIPIRIGTDNDWLTVSAGSDYTVAIKTDGSLWTWGANYRYQLGDTKISNPKIPNNIGDGWRVVSADKSHYEGLSHSTGSYHTIAIKRDGVLWSWGYNEFGSLGDASTKSNPIPTRVIESDW